MLKKGNEVVGISDTDTKTLSSNVSISKSVNAADYLDSNGRLVLDGLKGNQNGYIRVRGEGLVINPGDSTDESVSLVNSSYVILDGLTVKGGFKNGIDIASSCSNIIIRNCDISNWGRVGTVTATAYNDDGTVATVRLIDKNGDEINYDAGIKMIGVSDILVENCDIHSPNGNSTPWKGERDGVTWSFSHPQGSNGIYVKGERITVRYNNIVGSSNHRFNDCIEGNGNFSADGGFAADCDIYGNLLAFAEDDCIELDGGARNVRFFGNRMTASRTGISTAANCVGPSFIFNNLIHDIRDSRGRTEYFVKIGNDKKYGQGITHIFNNTFYSTNNTKGIVNLTGKYYNAVTGNNIIVNNGTGTISVRNEADGECVSSFDNDLIYNMDLSAPIISIASGLKKEENAILAAPSFKSVDWGLFSLNQGSPGAGAAVKKNGFEFEGRNVGALDGSFASMLPLRQVSVTLGKEYVPMSKSSSAAVSFTYNGDKTSGFEIIRLAGDDSRVEITPSSGQAVPNETVTLNLTSANYSIDTAYSDEIFLIRFEDGQSIPVGIRFAK